ncbi:MAG: DUF6923 family protein, partial [Candidatus Dormibacteraceae bacterium]
PKLPSNAHTSRSPHALPTVLPSFTRRPPNVLPTSSYRPPAVHPPSYYASARFRPSSPPPRVPLTAHPT